MSRPRKIVDPLRRPHGVLRKPSFTSIVRDGLRSIAAAYKPRTEEERRAIRWIAEASDYQERFTRREKLKAWERRKAKSAA